MESRTNRQPAPAIEARGITRAFPGVLANDRVTFEVRRGEVHGLLGENGSGKTTLCRILTGLSRPDGGEIRIDGRRVHFGSPRDGYAAGVFMVQQHFSLVDRLTVAENVVIGWSRTRRVRLDHRRVRDEVLATANEYRIPVDVDAFVWQLSVGERQRVEILKAMYRGARILILDEPTTVLTPNECEDLFVTLRRMAEAGASIVFISHKLREVLDVCDRVTVLRLGRTVDTVDLRRERVDPGTLAHLMVGRDVPPGGRRRTPVHTEGRPVVLDVEDLTVRNDFGRRRVRALALTVHRGEILGIAGVAGNGQRELAEAVTGLRPRESGSVRVNGRAVPGADPRAAIQAGMAHVPEDRIGTGLIPSLRVSDNVILKDFRDSRFSRGPFLLSARVLARTRELLERFAVRGRPDSLVRQLSGGNAQKVLLAREMSSEPAVLLVASPTRGLDVAATDAVRALIVEAAERGVAVVLISEDLDEVLDLSDRVAVMYDGRITSVIDPVTTDRRRIGMLMAGMETVA
ncbi:MAG TPA: ABC transporter ATP-binding protein [Actinomycetota bacterium]